MIDIIHKILVLIKNHMNYFKENIFKFFLRSLIDFCLLENSIFFHNIK